MFAFQRIGIGITHFIYVYICMQYIYINTSNVPLKRCWSWILEESESVCQIIGFRSQIYLFNLLFKCMGVVVVAMNVWLSVRLWAYLCWAYIHRLHLWYTAINCNIPTNKYIRSWSSLSYVRMCANIFILCFLHFNVVVGN